MSAGVVVVGGGGGSTFFKHFVVYALYFVCFRIKELPFSSFEHNFNTHHELSAPPSHFKTESIRKLSNFIFQRTKALYQNFLNNIAFFFTFFKGYRYNTLSVITPKIISHGSPRIVKTQVKL